MELREPKDERGPRKTELQHHRIEPEEHCRNWSVDMDNIGTESSSVKAATR